MAGRPAFLHHGQGEVRISMSSNTTQRLRFGCLTRVSTEAQEKHGESLRTQKKQITEAVQALGGVIAGWYGGQEHATPGHERKELDRLLADAAKGKFDAVIVANADRWSRDNVKSQSGLDVFKQNGVRFFVGSTEYSLHDPEHTLFLEVSCVIGKFQARHQTKKSVLNRIQRAKKGMPTSGKLPYGRTYDRAAGRWVIDPAKQAVVEEAARRYLAGESMQKLAAEFGMNHSSLHKTLTRRCGTEWVQEFRSEALNIHEQVTITVPALLGDETIRAIRRRVEANKTFTHGQLKHRYLLGRVVFCGHCGYAMFGQTNPDGGRYYRHAHLRRVRECPFPRAWVRAEDLESAELWQLFDLFGNPAAVRRAVEEATPNREQIDALRNRRERLAAALANTQEAQEKVLRLMTKGVVTEDLAEKQLGELKAEEDASKAQLEALDNELANVPSADQINEAAERCAATFGKYRIASARPEAKRMQANFDLDVMTWEEQRVLVEMVFAGKTPDGKRLGVYVEWVAGQEGRRRKCWHHRVRGRLIDAPGTAPCPAPEEPTGGALQELLLSGATESAGGETKFALY
jgi:DNA invertase Pin-like site-specific DNA recombinase